MTRITIKNRAEIAVVTQAQGDTVLRACVAAGVGFPYECSVGSCGTCKYELLEGEVVAIGAEPALTAKDREHNRRLACQTRGVTDSRIKVRLLESYRPKLRPRRATATLERTADITRDIREFQFRTGGPAEFLPGQYALLAIPGVRGSRAYSMANLANRDGTWTFQIRLTPGGEATSALFAARPGLSVELDGPYGFAYLDTGSPRDIVCIAGGSGLAPMLSITRGAQAAGMLETRKLFFFYGGRTAQDLCGEEQLGALEGFGRAIRYDGAVSGEAPDGSMGKFVHHRVAEELSGLENFEYYMAGPAGMVDAALRMLVLENNVPERQIHYDRFL